MLNTIGIARWKNFRYSFAYDFLIYLLNIFFPRVIALQENGKIYKSQQHKEYKEMLKGKSFTACKTFQIFCFFLLSSASSFTTFFFLYIILAGRFSLSSRIYVKSIWHRFFYFVFEMILWLQLIFFQTCLLLFFFNSFHHSTVTVWHEIVFFSSSCDQFNCIIK